MSKIKSTRGISSEETDFISHIDFLQDFNIVPPEIAFCNAGGVIMFSKLYDRIVAGKEKISLVGLGYVGMPIAVAFARKVKVIGFDLNAQKIALYKKGVLRFFNRGSFFVWTLIRVLVILG